MIQMYKQRGAISKSDFKLRDKLKNEGLPIEKPSKKRNMEIREHYFNTAKKLFLESQNEGDINEKKRKQLGVFSKLGGMLMTSQFQPEKSNK